MKTKKQEEFEKFCKEYNLEYNFDSLSGGYYKNWQTNQSFVIYKYAGERRK